MLWHLCSKNKDFLPCLPGQALDFNIFSTHKYKIFLLITFFKIFRNDWAHTGNIYSYIAIKCQCAQSFPNILKKVINKKIVHLWAKYVHAASHQSQLQSIVVISTKLCKIYLYHHKGVVTDVTIRKLNEINQYYRWISR